MNDDYAQQVEEWRAEARSAFVDRDYWRRRAERAETALHFLGADYAPEDDA